MLRKLWDIYAGGFRHMPRWGRVLMAIVVAKLLIMFLVFKMLLMPDYLDSRYDNDADRSRHVLDELTEIP